MNILKMKKTLEIFAVILLSLVLNACGGGSVASYNPVASNDNVARVYTPPSTIAAEAAACVAEPVRGTVSYYCDCGTGAQAGCVAGNDTNVGTSPSAPKRTIGNAITRFSSIAANDTVALCKGGAFNATGSLTIGNTTCTDACKDLREYTPTTFTGTAKPIINNASGEVRLFNFSGSTKGGIRLLNLKLVGTPDPVSKRNTGFFFYSQAHDVTMCNLDMDAFDVAIYNESNNGNTNKIKLTGSLITNSRVQGFLGEGDNLTLNYNYWAGNGSTDQFDHSVYFSSDSVTTINTEMIGNYVYGQYGNTCLGVAVVGHFGVDGFKFQNNVVEIDAAAASGGCYGVGFSPANQTGAKYVRNGVISGNKIINGGNIGFSIEGCDNCVIENNVIIQNWPSAYETIGMWINANSVRAGDDTGNGNLVRNNTIWFGPNATKGGTGIGFATQGTGHRVTNNSITYTATNASPNGMNCFDYTAPITAFLTSDNNHCFSNATYEWGNGRGDLAAWQAYSSLDANSKGGNPLFTNAPTSFTPLTGSALISAGHVSYKSATDFNGTTRPATPAIGAFEP
jgi:parallel beta-helix repeat protein